MESLSLKEKAPPPRLEFDDGSRIITENASLPLTTESGQAKPWEAPTTARAEAGVSVEDFYEVSRLSHEIISTLFLREDGTAKEQESSPDDGFSCRVALQFPDELLPDATQVTWLMEDALEEAFLALCQRNTMDFPPLVFILGDSTSSGSCCPDEMNALHLNADILVHYGHACLSPTRTVPVLYSFGLTQAKASPCAESILQQIRTNCTEKQKLLILYEVQYHHIMNELQDILTGSDSNNLLESIVIGKIPQHDLEKVNSCSTAATGCCGASNASCAKDSDLETGEKSVESNRACCNSPSSCDASELPADEMDSSEASSKNRFIIGGLEVPSDLKLSEHILLFIGDGTGDSRQYLNTMLRTSSALSTPMDHWSYDPTSSVISTGVPAFVKRQLNRRFYLTQKARESTIIGILVGSMSQRHSRTIVSHLQQLIEASGRACYTVAVGKINVAKLANFAEVDCFVLVACGENSILDQERDYHLPIVTPLELEIALGQKDWSLAEYSLDYNDVLLNVTPTKDAENNTGTKQTTTQDGFSSEQDDDDDGDEPYFSLVTGRYESSKRTAHTVPEDLNLAALPGQGQITAYESAGAEFLAKREYRGLQADVGTKEAKAAVEGSTGIASDYGHR